MTVEPLLATRAQRGFILTSVFSISISSANGEELTGSVVTVRAC